MSCLSEKVRGVLDECGGVPVSFGFIRRRLGLGADDVSRDSLADALQALYRCGLLRRGRLYGRRCYWLASAVRPSLADACSSRLASAVTTVRL